MIKQLLMESGLFNKMGSPRNDDVVTFYVKNMQNGATIYVQPSDREIHIRTRAFGNGRFGLCNESLHEFVKEHHSRTVRSPSNSSHAYVLSAEHVPGLIRIIATRFS